MAKKDLASGQRVVPPLGSDSDVALFCSTPHAGGENREPNTAAWRRVRPVVVVLAAPHGPRSTVRAAAAPGDGDCWKILNRPVSPAATTRGVDSASPPVVFFPREKDTAACRKWGRPGRAVVLPRSERPVSGDGDSTHSIRAHGLPAETSGRLFSPSVGKERGDDQI